MCAEASHSHALVHFCESALRLVEEAVHDALAEVALVLIIVHLEDLLEGGGVD